MTQRLIVRLTFLGALACTAYAWAQTTVARGETSAGPDELELKWRARIAADLKARGVTLPSKGPKLLDLDPVWNTLRPFLPEGKSFDRIARNGTAKSWKSVHVETLLDQTDKSQFLRVVDVLTERANDPAAAQELLARYLSTPVSYSAGPIQGSEPGQLCYHLSGGDLSFASEVYIRNNVVVALSCDGPIAHPKNRDMRHYKAEQTAVPGQCEQLVSDLALRIDGLIQGQLSER